MHYHSLPLFRSRTTWHYHSLPSFQEGGRVATILSSPISGGGCGAIVLSPFSGGGRVATILSSPFSGDDTIDGIGIVAPSHIAADARTTRRWRQRCVDRPFRRRARRCGATILYCLPLPHFGRRARRVNVVREEGAVLRREDIVNIPCY